MCLFIAACDRAPDNSAKNQAAKSDNAVAGGSGAEAGRSDGSVWSGGETLVGAPGDASIRSPIEMRVREEILKYSRQIKASPRYVEAYYQRGRLLRILSSFVPLAEEAQVDNQALRDLLSAHGLSGGDPLLDPQSNEPLTPEQAAGLPVDAEGWIAGYENVKRLENGALVFVHADGQDERVGGPGHARALYEAARLMMADINTDAAADFLERAERIAPGDFEIRAELIRARAFTSGEWSAAADEIENLSADAKAQQLPGVWHPLGFCRLQAGQFEQAGRALRRTLVLSRGHRAAEIDLALALFGQGQTDQAVAKLRKRFADCQRDVLVANDIAQTLMDRGRPDQALELLEALIEVTPAYPAAHYNLGEALGALGDFADALNAHKRAASLAPDWAIARRAAGRDLSRLGRHDEAVAAFRQSLELEPANAEGHFGLGNSYAAGKRYEEALAAYRWAVELDAKHDRAWNGIGLTLAKQQEFDEALSAYQTALGINPKNRTTLTRMAELARQRGDIDGAVGHYVRALELNPRDTSVLSRLCHMLVNEGRSDDALEQASRFIEKAPKSSDHHVLRADLRQESGDSEMAIADYTRAMELRSHAVLYLLRGRTYAHLGREQMALADVEQALKMSPADPIISLHMWLLQMRAENQEAAEAAVKAAVEKSDADTWPGMLVRYYSGELSREALFAAATDDGGRCEAYYYVGGKVAAERGAESARRWFEECVATNMTTFLEHRLARWWLERQGA